MEYFEDISGRWEDYYNLEYNELIFLYNIHKRTHIRLETHLRELIEEECGKLGYEVFLDFTYDRLFIEIYDGKKLDKEDVNYLCNCFDLIFECVNFECTTYGLDNDYEKYSDNKYYKYKYIFLFKRYLEKDWLKKLKEIDNKYLKKED